MNSGEERECPSSEQEGKAAHRHPGVQREEGRARQERKSKTKGGRGGGSAAAAAEKAAPPQRTSSAMKKTPGWGSAVAEPEN